MAIDDALVMVATVTTPGTSTAVNSMGDPVPGVPTTTTTACWCAQLSTDELTVGMDLTRQHWRLFAPADAAVSALSTVTVDAYPGITFSVDGVPWRAITPIYNEPSHLEAMMVATQ